MAAKHIIDLDFEVVFHPASILILINKGVQSVICFGFLAQMIPCGGHVFTDPLRDLLPYCKHFFTGNILRKVHVDVNRQPG